MMKIVEYSWTLTPEDRTWLEPISKLPTAVDPI